MKSLFSRYALIVPAICLVTSVAIAQMPTNAPPVGTTPDAAPSLKGTAESAVAGIANSVSNTAADLRDKVMPNVNIPGVAPAMPEQIPGVPSGFGEGQDHSVSVGSEGKPESIFFTPNQLASIMRAKEGFLAPREAFDPNNQGDPTTGGSRVVSLAGIIYVNSKDWVIWLNGERVTRKNMPQRLVGLTVRANVAHLRWLDVPNQRVVNITLHPHQQYLLDSDTIIPADY